MATASRPFVCTYVLFVLPFCPNVAILRCSQVSHVESPIHRSVVRVGARVRSTYPKPRYLHLNWGLRLANHCFVYCRQVDDIWPNSADDQVHVILIASINRRQVTKQCCELRSNIADYCLVVNWNAIRPVSLIRVIKQYVISELLQRISLQTHILRLLAASTCSRPDMAAASTSIEIAPPLRAADSASMFKAEHCFA